MTESEKQEAIETVIRALRRNSFGPAAMKARRALIEAGHEADLEAAIDAMQPARSK